MNELYTSGLVRRNFRPRLSFAVFVALALAAGGAQAQDDAARVDTLLRDLKGRDFEKASAADTELRKFPHARARIVAGLIDALKTGAWDRCGGDMRDAIARSLGELNAKEAVVPLLDVVKSGKSIEHECSE
jgi:HEAT repeat protein